MIYVLPERSQSALFRLLGNLKKSIISYFGQGIRREVISITWPAFIELVLSTLFGMVDMMMVGNLSSAAIAAVGLTTQPFLLLMSVFAAVNVGTTTLVAWNIGAGKVAKASDVTRQIIVLNVFLGVIMSVAGIFLAPHIVTFMGANEDTLKDATIYFQIVSGGLLFQAMTMGVTAALRGAGQTRIPMYYNIGSNLLNVFGNYVLIYGKLGFPKYGVAGAAISTTFSRLVACVAALYILYSGRTKIRINRMGRFRFDFNVIKKVMSIGIPSALEQFVIHSGLMMFARTVSGLGTTHFAAHQIGLNISGLSFAPGMAFGVASTTLVGQSLGANDRQRAKKCANVVHHMALAVAVFVGLIFVLFSHPMARLYNKEVEVVALAGLVLKILALALPGQCTQLSLAGALRGAGDTMYPLYASAFGIWGFRVVVAHVFVNIFQWGLVGAWVALVMDQTIRALIVYVRYRSDKWLDAKSRHTKEDAIKAEL
ncbi:MAG: MATE family efflux transporter [Clostridiaceae bacterium]|jgi:putative MATE family efflux protein|nr:MATE family efflux transporter [Clostridiaceae bacterium]